MREICQGWRGACNPTKFCIDRTPSKYAASVADTNSSIRIDAPTFSAGTITDIFK